jgi:hydrogenase maturation protease
MKPILILACGNALRGDDGVAWHIGSALEAELIAAGVELILTRQLQPEHAEPLSRANTAIFLDCSAVDQPGIVSTRTLQPAQSLPRIFSHNLDPASLLKLSLDLYGRIPSRSEAITVGGESFALREQLSQPVKEAIPIAIQAVRRAIFASEQESVFSPQK